MDDHNESDDVMQAEGALTYLHIHASPRGPIVLQVPVATASASVSTTEQDPLCETLDNDDDNVLVEVEESYDTGNDADDDDEIPMYSCRCCDEQDTTEAMAARNGVCKVCWHKTQPNVVDAMRWWSKHLYSAAAHVAYNDQDSMEVATWLYHAYQQAYCPMCEQIAHVSDKETLNCDECDAYLARRWEWEQDHKYRTRDEQGLSRLALGESAGGRASDTDESNDNTCD
jgi:hypothetical protein